MAPVPSEFLLAEIATVMAGLLMLAIAALSYMRAVNALGELKEKPNFRPWLVYTAWFPLLLSGLLTFDVNDARYPVLLWRARRRLVLCFLIFLAIIVAIGWFSRGP